MSEEEKSKAQPLSERAKSTTDQLQVLKESQAASLAVMYSEIRAQTSTYITFEFHIESVGGMSPAKKVDITWRVDLLADDFKDRVITYPGEAEHYPLFQFEEVHKTPKLDFQRAQSDEIGKTLWPYLHIQVAYDNGFGKRVTIHRGFRFDRSNLQGQCKLHTYIETVDISNRALSRLLQ